MVGKPFEDSMWRPKDGRYEKKANFPKDGSQQRPYDTVVPLSQSLGISIDTSCQRDDSDCVADVIDNYDGSGNILVW